MHQVSRAIPLGQQINEFTGEGRGKGMVEITIQPDHLRPGLAAVWGLYDSPKKCGESSRGESLDENL
jgi:hypothetical protein